MTLLKYTISVCLLLFILTSCALPDGIFIPSKTGNGKAINWSKLWPIIMDVGEKLASQERHDNIKGLETLIGEKNTKVFIKVFDIGMLAFKTYHALKSGTNSRDTYVIEVLNRYEKSST